MRPLECMVSVSALISPFMTARIAFERVVGDVTRVRHFVFGFGVSSLVVVGIIVRMFASFCSRRVVRPLPRANDFGSGMST